MRNANGMILAVGIGVVLVIGAGKVLIDMLITYNTPRLPRQPWDG